VPRAGLEFWLNKPYCSGRLEEVQEVMAVATQWAVSGEYVTVQQ